MHSVAGIMQMKCSRSQMLVNCLLWPDHVNVASFSSLDSFEAEDFGSRCGFVSLRRYGGDFWLRKMTFLERLNVIYM